MQPRILSLLLLTAIASFIISCKSKSDKKSTTTDSTSIVTADTTTKMMSPRLFCKSMGEDSSANPHADVIFSANGTETKVASINACSDIDKADYKTYEIPDNAISAVGGFWAGLGSYFYLVEKDGKFVVFEGFTEEGQKEKGYYWKEWKSE